jgi:hypothetical protein
MGDDGIGLEARLHTCAHPLPSSIRGKVGFPVETGNVPGSFAKLSCPGKEAFCGYLHHSESLFC